MAPRFTIPKSKLSKPKDFELKLEVEVYPGLKIKDFIFNIPYKLSNSAMKYFTVNYLKDNTVLKSNPYSDIIEIVDNFFGSALGEEMIPYVLWVRLNNKLIKSLEAIHDED